MKEAEKRYWEYEKKLEAIAAPQGWSVDEMLDIYRHELDFKTAIEVHNILKRQVQLIDTIYPHLSNVHHLSTK